MSVLLLLFSYKLGFAFAFQLTFARFYLPAYLPDAEKAIYLDDDVIVQGKTLLQRMTIIAADLMKKVSCNFYEMYTMSELEKYKLKSLNY